MTTHANIQLIQELYAAFARGDVRSILERCAEDVDWGVDAKTNVPWHGVGKGRAAAAKFFETLGRECEITRFEPHSFIGSDDGVACLVDCDVTVRKNGKTATVQDIHFFKIRGGRITLWRGSEDTALTRDLWNG
jgi:uncharacterized protein